MRKLLAALLCICMLVMLIPVSAFADGAATTKTLSDYSVQVTIPQPTDNIESVNSALSDSYLENGTDYTITSDNTLVISYSYLSGSRNKEVWNDDDTLFINYKDGTCNSIEVKNYNISLFENCDSSDYVYTGKKSVAKPSMGIGSGYYKITYSKASRSAIGTYKYTVRGVYPYTGKLSGTYKVIPKSPSKVTAKYYSSKCSLKWNKVTNCSGYKISFYKEVCDGEGDDTSYKLVKTVWCKSKSTSSKTVSIKRSSYDKVTVRAYKNVSGKKYYSKAVNKYR